MAPKFTSQSYKTKKWVSGAIITRAIIVLQCGINKFRGWNFYIPKVPYHCVISIWIKVRDQQTFPCEGFTFATCIKCHLYSRNKVKRAKLTHLFTCSALVPCAGNFLCHKLFHVLREIFLLRSFITLLKWSLKSFELLLQQLIS